MKLRKIFILLMSVLLIGSMTMAAPAMADVIGDCSLTGYTFMGGGIAYTNSAKDYFLAQPLVEESAGYWGYGWLKFDNLSETTVDSAYLVVDVLGSGSMSISELSETNVGDLSIYSSGDTDVATLGASTSARSTLQTTLASDDSLLLTSDTNMISNGLYYIDITDLYNSWVDGTNNGLVLTSDLGLKMTGIGSTVGTTPYISTSAVPVPGAVWLMITGLLGMTGLRRRNRA